MLSALFFAGVGQARDCGAPRFGGRGESRLLVFAFFFSVSFPSPLTRSCSPSEPPLIFNVLPAGRWGELADAPLLPSLNFRSFSACACACVCLWPADSCPFRRRSRQGGSPAATSRALVARARRVATSRRGVAQAKGWGRPAWTLFRGRIAQWGLNRVPYTARISWF